MVGCKHHLFIAKPEERLCLFSQFRLIIVNVLKAAHLLLFTHFVNISIGEYQLLGRCAFANHAQR